MLATSLIWMTGAVVLGCLFWCSVRECVALLLAIWAVAIGIFVSSNLADRFLWIPVLLALFGVFGSILMLAISSDIILAANAATLVLFGVALEVVKGGRHSPIALVRHHAR